MNRIKNIMLKALLIDIDGTLLDSNESHAETFVKAFAKYNKDVSVDEFRPLIGMGADKILEKFLSPEEIREFGDELKEYRKDIFLKDYLPKIKTFHKLRELFEKIESNGIQTILATSAGDEEIKEYKKKLDISDLLEEETSADDAEESKPAPDIFEAAFSKLKDVEKKEVLIIGDTIWDAKAAIRSQIKMIGVTSGGWSAEKLYSEGCIKVYRDIAEIYDRFDEVLALSDKFEKAAN